MANLTDAEPEWTNHAADQAQIVKHLQGLYETWEEDVVTDATSLPTS